MRKIVKFSILLCFFCTFISCGSPESQSWQKTKTINTVSEYQYFIEKFPDSVYKLEAEQAIEDLIWHRSINANTVYWYLHYGKKFPKGRYIEDAKVRVAGLQKTFVLENQLERKTLVGSIDFPNSGKQTLAIQFKDVRTIETGLQFSCVLNCGQIRVDALGLLNQKDNSISFEEDENAKLALGLTNGRMYKTGDAFFLESTDANQYWKVE